MTSSPTKRHIEALGLDEGRAPTLAEWRAFVSRMDEGDAALPAAAGAASEQRPDEAAALLRNLREKSLAVLQKNAATLAENLALAKAVQESVADGIMVVGIGGKLLSTNQRFREMWTLPAALASSEKADLVLEHMKTVVKDPEQLRAMVRTSVEQPDAVYTNAVELKDGRVYDRYVAPVPTRDGKLYGRVICYREVTEQRRLDAQRAASADRMTTVRELAEKMRVALDAKANGEDLRLMLRELSDVAGPGG